MSRFAPLCEPAEAELFINTLTIVTILVRSTPHPNSPKNEAKIAVNNMGDMFVGFASRMFWLSC